MQSIIFLAITNGFAIALIVLTLSKLKESQRQQQKLIEQLHQFTGHAQARETQQSSLEKRLSENQLQQQEANAVMRERFDANQLKGLKLIQESIHQGIKSNQEQATAFLSSQVKHMNEAITQLNKTTQAQLERIQDQVDKRLSEGFEKTQATFTDVVKRLAIIDAAQQKITELSTNVVDLQHLLSDKRARGAFGEMQLATLLRDLIPEGNMAFQYTFSNGKRADCVLFLPEPTGTIAIDAKFPLENYQRLIDSGQQQNNDQVSSGKSSLVQLFRTDIKRHIDAIAQKYILPGETADGAIMFIPSEAIFCEIHAYHAPLIQYGQEKRVWLVSPTTMMAVVTTAATVLKDAATRQQIHLIQEHLVALGKDFGRFRQRMSQLAKHIEQAHHDADQVHITSQKIASRFDKIEQVDLPKPEQTPELTQHPEAVLETIET